MDQRNQSRTTREGRDHCFAFSSILTRRRVAFERQSLQTNDGIEPGCSRIYCALPKVLPYRGSVVVERGRQFRKRIDCAEVKLGYVWTLARTGEIAREPADKPRSCRLIDGLSNPQNC
jgi:hypothetical protein